MMDDQTVESEDEKIAPADIDLQSSFYDAIKKSDGALFDSLIQNKKVKINEKNSEGVHPAILAFNTLINSYPNEDGKKIIFRLLAEKKIKLKGIVDSKDNNLLHQLFTKLDLFNYFFEGKDTKEIQNLIQLLIDKGTDINAQNKAGDTVLHKWLTLFGVIQTEGITEIQSAVTQLLIDNKADNTIKNKFNRTPLESGTKGSKIAPKQLEVMFENTKKLGVTTMQSAITAIEGNVAKNIPELNDSVKASQAAIEAFVPNYVPGILDDVKEGTTDKNIVIKDLALLAEKICNIIFINPGAVEMLKEIKYQNSDGEIVHLTPDYQTSDGSTLFSIAIDYGKLEVFEFLVHELTKFGHSVGINDLPLTESHPLYYAIANYDSDPKFLQILIKEIGVKDLTKTLMNNDNSDLAPVIVWAIQNEYFSAVAELLNTKAFLEAVDKAGLFEDKQTPHTNFINMLSWQGKQVISDEEFINAVLNADSKVAYDLLVSFEKAEIIINGAAFNINDYRSNDGKSLFSIAAEVNNEEGNNDLFKLLLKDKLKDKKAPITEIEIDLVFKTDDNDSINILFTSGNKNLSVAFAAYLENNIVQAESIIKKVTDNVDTQILGALKWFGDCLNSLETGIGKVIQEEFKDDEKVQDLTDDDIVKLFPKENKVNKPDEQILKWLKTGATFKGKPLTWNSIIIDTDGLGYTPIGLAVKYGRDGTFERMSKKASKESKDGKYIDGVDISAGEVGESYTMFLILKSPPEGLEKNERKKYLKKQEKYFEYLANYTNKGLLLYAFLKLDEIGKPAVKYIEEQLEQNIEDIKVLTKSGMWKKAAKNKKFGEIILEYKELYDRSGKELELLKAYQDQAFTSFGITVPQEVIGDRITDIESIHSGELSITSLSRSSSNKNISPKNASPSEGVVTHLRNLSIVDENREKGLTPKADFEVVVVFSDNGNEELKKVMGDNSQPGDDS